MKIADLLSYDPDTGIFRWKVPGQGRRVGGIAGHFDPAGYNLVRVNYVMYRGARLAWYLSYGVWPKEVDHINRDKHDDRLSNLREVTHAENIVNTSTRTSHGEKYIYWNKRQEKWEVKIKNCYAIKWLGVYSSYEEALRVRNDYLAKLANPGGSDGECDTDKL